MEDVKKRIRDVLGEKHVTVNNLAISAGINQAKLNNQINSTTQMSANTILLVLNRFPELSAEWLLRGTGSMWVEDNHETVTRQIRDDSDTIAALRQAISAQQKTIEAQETTIRIILDKCGK